MNLRFPLDRVYIRLQAVEEKRQRQQEAEERRALEAQIEARRAGSPFRDILGTLRLLGEYFYRRGQVYQAEKRPEPVDPQEALEKHPRLVILGAPGAGKACVVGRGDVGQSVKGGLADGVLQSGYHRREAAREPEPKGGGNHLLQLLALLLAQAGGGRDGDQGPEIVQPKEPL